MLVQISSGQDPAECELAVGLLAKSLQAEFFGLEIIRAVKSRRENCFSSITLKIDDDENETELLKLEGTVLWICRSPFRPNHKRKNWFVDVSILSAAKILTKKRENSPASKRSVGGG